MEKGLLAGETLSALLKERGMSQTELARRAGLKRQQVSDYVRNKQGLGERNAIRIADALGVPLREVWLPRPGLETEVEDLRRRVEELSELVERLTQGRPVSNASP